jgi:hypothetical protein
LVLMSAYSAPLSFDSSRGEAGDEETLPEQEFGDHRAGITTRNNARSGPQPSTSAASSSARGMESKYPTNSQTGNGSENVR